MSFFDKNTIKRNTIKMLYSGQYLCKNFRLRFAIITVFLLGNVLASSSLYAQSNELSLKQLLLTPGKLTQAHAKIENQCSKCHANFDKSNQSPLCLECHTKINTDIKNSKGFHSNLSQKERNQCQLCHSDHKGRNFNITSLDIDHFDHSKTEFELEGIHKRLSCDDCHKVSEKKLKEKEGAFRLELKAGKCLSCHADQHENKLDKKCSKCHNQTNWHVNKFDHNKTDFALKGKHQQVACKLCHINDVSVKIGSQCTTCHLSKDKHLGVFGKKCTACHSEKTWKKEHYDHFKETKYRLVGKHKKLACSTCHTTPVSKNNNASKTNETCNSCHKNDDIHSGNNGTNCEQCHNNSSWSKSTFKHNKDTQFTLEGIHQKLHCDACHLPNTLKQFDKKNHSKKVRKCYSCHQLNDPHKGKLGKKCQSCHKQQKWQSQITFNHDFSRFPLTGGHKLLVCQSCHESADFEIKNIQCSSCHASDDIHESTLGKKCEQCHNTSSWSTWQFDHQIQTKFPLEGAHQNLTCKLCHSSELTKPLSPPKACVDCHQPDDVHQGSFGQDCQRCHNMESFNDF